MRNIISTLLTIGTLLAVTACGPTVSVEPNATNSDRLERPWVLVEHHGPNFGSGLPSVSSNTYDETNHLVASVDFPPCRCSESPRRETTHRYSKSRFVSYVKVKGGPAGWLEDGLTTTFEIDEAGLIRSVDQGSDSARRQTYDYNDRGELMGIERLDSIGRVVRNSDGRITEYVHDAQVEFVATYDNVGHLIKTESSGSTVAYLYEGDRVVASSTDGTHGSITRFTYTDRGQIATANDYNLADGKPTQQRAFSYDADGRLTLSARTDADGEPMFQHAYTYGPNGRLASHTITQQDQNHVTTYFYVERSNDELEIHIEQGDYDETVIYRRLSGPATLPPTIPNFIMPHANPALPTSDYADHL